MRIASLLLCASIFVSLSVGQTLRKESRAQYDARMSWWKDARFGLFIHWGLYSIPAGEWGGKTDYGEWIRTNAQIPLETYNKFVDDFNPVNFNAREWVRLAKEAGMKYITITTKHHDGFCLFDSKFTDFDVMATPFKRDVMKELSDACREEGIRICWYHSIMDWHHPDYLPRREWETTRTAAGAEYERYITCMKNQLKELLTKYGPIGVLWFDGEWESTWNKVRGRDLYNVVRALQPDIIVNNRVGAGRSGMEGFSEDAEAAGDFGTPEQQIPSTGFPGINWETCMTMNDHWGYNNNDSNWKSSANLIRMLADIASKGGNFLLNVGPTSAGEFPPASVQRLHDIGRWMKVNGESIYGTDAGPFESLAWGRCTQKSIGKNIRLYLHVLTPPSDGKLIVPGLASVPHKAFLLADRSRQPLRCNRTEDAVAINLPVPLPDTVNTVVVVDLKGKADVVNPPKFLTDLNIFIDSMEVKVKGSTAPGRSAKEEIRYTTDGSVPTRLSSLAAGGVVVRSTTTLTLRTFRNGKPVSGAASATYRKVEPLSPRAPLTFQPGLAWACYEGEWDSLPDFSALKPAATGNSLKISLDPRTRDERFGLVFNGYIKIPFTGVYSFYTASDDGSDLSVDDSLVVRNDGLHGTNEMKGNVALAAGFHRFELRYFNKTGGLDLSSAIQWPGMGKKPIPDELFSH